MRTQIITAFVATAVFLAAAPTANAAPDGYYAFATCERDATGSGQECEGWYIGLINEPARVCEGWWHTDSNGKVDAYQWECVIGS